ncbi:MAG: hypothetical protein IJX72_05700 [Clostridia bacterium]|nr:hypothetical protein [Clostridia bacterium]
MRVPIRLLIGTVFTLCLICVCSLTALAEDTSSEAVTMPPAYADLEDCVPPDVADLLPDGLFSDSAEEALTAAEALSDWQYLLNALFSAVGLRLEDAVGLLCALLGLILIAAILGKLRESIGGAGGETFGFCLRLALYTAIVLQTAGMVKVVQTFFSQLNTLMGGMIPVMGGLYALGGNLGQAAVSEELMLVFLTVCEYVSTAVTPPVCAVCMSFSLMDAFGLRLTLAPLCEQVKRWYTSLLGLIMFLLSLALSVQSVLVGRADSLGMKGVKYAVGNMLPVVGGAVAGTLGTVSAAVSLLRGVCGVSGIILVALLLLPTLVQLLLFRATLRLASTAASLLGCDGESRLLTEMASLHGYLAAAVSICAVTFILALSLLIHSTAALA